MTKRDETKQQLEETIEELAEAQVSFQSLTSGMNGLILTLNVHSAILGKCDSGGYVQTED